MTDAPAQADVHGRPLKNLRISVTDRCNLRCAYCMPEHEYVWLARERILRFEEISRLVDAFVSLGVDKERLTGGEPLLRRDLHWLVAMLAEKPGIQSFPRESKRRRRGPGKGVSTISTSSVSGSMRPMRRWLSWLNQTPPSGATSIP